MIYFVINKLLNFVINIYPLNIILKKNNNTSKDVIYEYLNKILKEWKNNEIKDLDLICDLIYIYNKYNLKNIDYVLTDNKIDTDMHMKYYILGWYMYQNSEKK